MLLLWSLPLGLAVGYLRGGRLKNLTRLELRGAGLILAAFVIQLLIFPLPGLPGPLIPWGTAFLHLTSYALLAGFVVLNRREGGIVLLGMGMLLNVLVISANGGYMPTYPQLLEWAGLRKAAQALAAEGFYGNNVCIGCEGISTRLTFLGDVFATPDWVPGANVFSLGDLVLALGLVYFLQAKMRAGTASASASVPDPDNPEPDAEGKEGNSRSEAGS